jgi:hypothetical protein
MNRLNVKTALIALCMLTPSPAVHADHWFIENTALTNTHKLFLEGDSQRGFQSLIEVWQQLPSISQQQHLDKLINSVIELDCGRSLKQIGMPEWLDGVTIERQSIQSPGRLSHKVIVRANTPQDLDRIRLIRWPDVEVINESGPDRSDGVESKYQYSATTETLNTRAKSGLYKIQVVSDSKLEWEAWIILAEPHNKELVRWSSKQKWTTYKSGLLNKYCPLPTLDLSLHTNKDSRFHKVWTEQYEGDYPIELPKMTLPDDRYVLAVSLKHRRWQGSITILDTQTITKTIDLSTELFAER